MLDASLQIRKRDGTLVPYRRTKITHAIFAAAAAVGGTNYAQAELLAEKVEEAIHTLEIDPLDLETLQDIVERVLIETGHPTTAKAYILYRQERAERRRDMQVAIDVERTIEEYLDRQDWRVQANSNQGYSLGGLILNTAGKVTANYWLTHVYPESIGRAHREGDIHIHDLDMFSGYCAGWSLRMLLEEGFNGVSGKTESGPPQHLSSAVSQMVNFLGALQNEWAGAQAFSSFDTYLAPFVRKYADELRDDLRKEGFAATEEYVTRKTYEHVKQQLQSFVFNLNVPSRWGTQTPFTNITLDWTCPVDLEDKRLKLGGEYAAYTFGELQREMDILNSAFIEVMTEGDRRGRVFTFPIPTYNITPEFDWEGPNTEKLFDMTAKYGMPYFQNFLNSTLKPNQVRSMCCRLQLDLTELLMRGNGLFGSAEMTGSIGVVTLNLARLGYVHAGDEAGFLAAVTHLTHLARTSLEIKRKEVTRALEQGLFPYTKRYLGHFDNHFSTIGINGMQEAILNFSDGAYDLATPEGQAFALRVLDHMRSLVREAQEETGNMYNLEATPAEGTTYRFAKEDQKRYPDIRQAGLPHAPYYTNSSQLPVEYTDDAFRALVHQEPLQQKYTGGTVFHMYLGERVSSAESCKALVRQTLTRFRIPYLTITPTFSICPVHGYLASEHEVCPRCREEQQVETECEVWTRVMGYHRPVKSFNIGKQSEHRCRQHFSESMTLQRGAAF